MSATFDGLDGRGAHQLFEFAHEVGGLWGRDDLPAILQNLLSGPVGLVLGDAALRQPLGESLRDPALTARTLQQIKDAMHDAAGRCEALLPREVALLLYYTCIAIALCRFGQAPTTLTGEQLRRGLRWVGEQDWAPLWITETAAQSLQGLDSTA